MIRSWAKRDKVNLCFTPTNASSTNPIEANSQHPNHTAQTRALQPDTPVNLSGHSANVGCATSAE
jgi:hypothetical protein